MNPIPTSLLAFAAAAFCVASAPASAHVTLATTQAPATGYFKAVFNVPHGCKGSPTLKVRIRVPDGVISVKPQPKPGWQLDVVQGAYVKPYTLHGAQVSSGVREISWTGRLPDAYFDDFAFMAYVTADLPVGTVVHFPVVQECEKGVSRWIDTTEASDSPAPRLTIVPKP